METKFESSVREIPYPQQNVYDMLSDLSNLQRVKDRVPEGQLNGLEFDSDTVSMNVNPVGTISMRIIDREEPKCIKFETVNSPLPFNFWIQMLPVTESTSKMRLTIKAELNPFIKGMVSKPLNEALEKIADAMAMMNYDPQD
jgi:hypothetical protein